MTYPSLIFCDTCGAANRVQAAFCKVCGRSFQSTASSTQGASLGNTSSPGLNTSTYPSPVRTTNPSHPNTPAPASMRAAQQSSTGSPNSTSGTLTGRLARQHVLKQRYIVLAQVGQGGFGAVYRASDTQFGGRHVAIKEMSQTNLNSQELLEATAAFYREAMMLASLTHPNLPRIYEQFTDAGRSYLVMDFIDGQTLDDMLQQRKFPVEQVLHIGMQLCDVLDYLHTRQPPIIFRDLKPANVMLTSTNHLYLIDFGIARHFKPGQTKDTTALGSSGYAAPEQYGKAQTTARADIYSLGATLHQLLTGNDPSDSPFSFAPISLPHASLSGLDTLILSMVNIDSSKRPAHINEVRRELQRVAMQYQLRQIPTLSQHLSPSQAALSQPSYTAGKTPVPPAPTVVSKPKQGPQIRPQANMLYACYGHASRITALAWSPDGKWLASTSYDKTVQLWNAANGQHVFTYKGHLDRVNDVVWSPDSTRLASASDDGVVHIWDVTNRKRLFTFGEHIGPVNALSWAPLSVSGGSFIASGGADRTVQVWNASTGNVAFVFRNHTHAVHTIAWSPDGKRIASGGEDLRVLLWSPTGEPQQKRSFFTMLTGSLTSSHRVTKIAEHEGRINALAWSPDNRYLASASSDYRVLVLDTLTNRTLFTCGTDSKGMKNCVAWSSNGRYIAFGGNNKQVELWNVTLRKQSSIYRGHTNFVNALTWSPDGSRIASAGVDHTIQVWQAT